MKQAKDANNSYTYTRIRNLELTIDVSQYDAKACKKEGYMSWSSVVRWFSMKKIVDLKKQKLYLIQQGSPRMIAGGLQSERLHLSSGCWHTSSKGCDSSPSWLVGSPWQKIRYHHKHCCWGVNPSHLIQWLSYGQVQQSKSIHALWPNPQ
jgi:hypothetical protein